MDVKVPLKLVYRDNIVRVSADAASLSLDVLERLVLDAFGVQFVALKYTDPEGDLVSVVADDDVHTALALFAKADGSFGTVRITAMPTARAVFHESVVEPVVKAMEQLVETLDAAKDSVKRDERVQRAAASANAHLRSDVLQSAVADARESLCAVRDRLQEIPFDQLAHDASAGLKTAAASAAERAKVVVADAKNDKRVHDAAEGLKTAAEGIRQFAADAVADAQRDPTVQDLTAGIKTVAAGVGEVAMEAVDELKSKVAPYLAPPAATAVVAPEVAAPVPEVAAPVPEVTAPVVTDADWEQVAVQPDEPVVTQVAPEELCWADALATIREIVPSVDTSRAIAELERANGNIELALDALLVEDM